ncbi:methyltransferase-like protein [Thermothelomyces thermophilus ATCC 42464]|uniref:Methyltransferase-like protein n=1 Tax=Thermothelomyces thermophilus (strain ATCC 42464 / BCRC 31852 / DSM 1799) TaxID=573729 RepID=G2QLV7_THET4|nr:methyltransferase-like protein [Thermothelomyces thermophilus ATCC 42464]AEO60937.1 methyltransferase-like protein [Thermothelomyces thermophilus ATCC 42464]
MAARTKELHKFFNEIKSHGTTELFLDNARRVSAPLAARLLKQMGLGEHTSTPFKLFENACGVGVVAPLLQQLIKPDVLKSSSILCGDFSEQVVEVARQRNESEGWVNTEVRKIDGQRTGLDDGAFTHVATSIGFHVIPDSEAALNEAIRILQPGGILGLTTWHREAGWVTEIKEAVKEFPFEAPIDVPMQTTAWGNWSDVNWLRKTLEEKGLQDVKVDVYAFLSRCDGPDHFIQQFGSLLDALLMGSWPEEVRQAHPKEEVLQLIKEHVTKKYGGQGWDLSWVAAVATGRVPYP